MMSFLTILGLCFAQEIVFVPSITDNPLLSKGLREALSISARGRDRYILTTQNFNLYIEQHNLDLYSIAEKQQALEQAKALKAKHLILATYTQKDQDHILKAQIYRSDLGAIQATVSQRAQSLTALEQLLPSFGEQLLSYTMIEEGITDPLSYPMVDIPSGAYLEEGARRNIKGFQIARFEVSQALYMAIMHENPSRREDCDALSPIKTLKTPVSCVSLFDAAHFANSYSQRMGKEICYEIQRDQITRKKDCAGYRLPTSQEWF